MKFHHAFVVARLCPAASARWTSYFGKIVAGQLRTRPFVALRVHWSEELGFPGAGITYPYAHRGLFIVSREKPRAPFQDFYFPLIPGNDKKEPLTLNHLLTDRGPVYLHMFPAVIERYEEATRDQPIEPSYHQLDAVSYHRLASFFRDVRPPRIPLPRPGGHDDVQSSWSTFSGQSDYEYQRPQSGFVFDFGPFSADVLNHPAEVCDELVLCEKMTKEYSWDRVSFTIGWLERLRDTSVDLDTFSYGACAYEGDIPVLSDTHSRSLFSIKVPVDGRPPSQEEQTSHEGWDEDPWGEDPVPSFARVDPQGTVIPQKDIKLVALDIFGVLFDRTQAVRVAVQKLGLGNAHCLKWQSRLRELEALEYRTHGGTYEQVARRSLRTLLTYASKPPNDETDSFVEAAVDALMHLPVIPGAETFLAVLKGSGFHIVGFSSIDATTFNDHLQASVGALPFELLLLPSDMSGLFSPCTGHIQQVADYAKARHPQFSPEQILVVSSSSVRVLEPATAQGMTTALLNRKDDPEISCLYRIYTSMSTMVASSVEDLPGIIRSPSLWKRSEVAETDMWSQNLRVLDMYQLDIVLGSSSDASVSRAVNWLNGEVVAVKVAMSQPSGSIIPYEAQIYQQLAGSRAMPSIHWSGTDGNADVLVMDYLGPTLEQMRLACQGSLTLKSVLMIGLQILDFVEFAHSRGIILRDVKPHNFAVGRAPKPDNPATIYAFDFGLAKMYVDPVKKTHIPLRTGRTICGTIRYSSHWSHLGIEASRRDDIVVLGHTLLHLLHGHLPWQGIYAASVEAKLSRIGEMKAPINTALKELLSRSPVVLRDFMAHGHSLDFEQKPDYKMLRGFLEDTLREHGWDNDGLFDWVEPSLAPLGTLLPQEYKYLPNPNMVPATIRPLSG